MATYFEWYPPRQPKPIRFGNAPYILREFDGAGVTGSEPQAQKSPFQIGQTLINTDINSRTISISIRVVPVGGQSMDELRAALVRSCAIRPVQGTERPQVGILRIYRDDLPPLEIEAVPPDSPQIKADISNTFADADFEFFCPDPLWRDISDQTATISIAGGSGLPMNLPYEFSGAITTAIIYNDSDVPVPLTARAYGEMTTFRLINDSSDEIIQVTGSIPAGQHVRVKTGFGEKEVVAVAANGAETNAMNRISLDIMDFWQLQTGENVIRLEADSSVDGRAELTWRNRYAGV